MANFDHPGLRQSAGQPGVGRFAMGHVSRVHGDVACGKAGRIVASPDDQETDSQPGSKREDQESESSGANRKHLTHSHCTNTKPKNSMTNSIKFDSAKLTSLREAAAAAAEASSQCDKNLDDAEDALESVGDSNSEASAEELFERSESARKNLFLRKTEAERASAKLAESKRSFHDFMRAHHSDFLNFIQGEINQLSTSLKGKLSPLIASGGGHEQATLDEFIAKCDGVRELKASHYRISLQLPFKEWDNMASEVESVLALLSKPGVASLI